MEIHPFVRQKHGETSAAIACKILIANSKREIERHQLLTVKVQLESVHLSPVPTKRDDITELYYIWRKHAPPSLKPF